MVNQKYKPRKKLSAVTNEGSLDPDNKEYWKDQYIELLEKYKGLLTKVKNVLTKRRS